MVSMGAGRWVVPALLTTISTFSCSLKMSIFICSTLFAFDTSTSKAYPPVPSATLRALSRSISATMTFAPFFANKSAIEAPNPEPPPVIIAVLSFSCMINPFI